MRVNFKIVIFLCLSSLSCFSQDKVTKKIDSLKGSIFTSNTIKKIEIYNSLYKLYRGIDLDSSDYYSKKSLDLALESKDDKIIGISWHHRANFYYDKGLNIKSLESFKKALDISIKLKDSILLSKVYKDLGGLHSHISNFNLSIKYVLKSLYIFEKLNDTINIANAYLELGTNFHRSKKFKEANIYNKKALSIYKKRKVIISQAIVYNNISNSFNGLQQYKEAILYAEKARDIFLNLGYKRYTAYPKGNMAIAYDSLHNYKIAKELYLESIKIHEKNKQIYELAFLKNGLANLYLKEKKYKKAIEVANQSLDYSKSASSLEFETFSNRTLAKIYRKTKNHKKHAFYIENYAILKDSLFKVEESKTQLELKEQYESSEKEKEIIQQKEQLLKQELAIKNRNLYAILLTSALLILGIIFFAIYKRNQLKRNQLQKEIDLKDALSKIKTQNRLQEQRLRISRDLHDNIGSQLTFIISSIDNLKYVSKDVNTKLKDKLSNISSFTGDTIHQLRDTIWAMNKSEITVEDLHSRVLSFIEKAKTAITETKFEIVYNIDKNNSFSSLVGMNLFRVIQEAINNAIKYADAQKIEVHLSKNNDNFIISIIDDGEGFDINTVELGNGLSNMEKRMSEIDGKININTTIKKGTEIKVELPLKNTPNDV